MISEPLFVWIFLPGQTRPVVAGRLAPSQTAAGKLGRFVYGKSYLGRSDAIPIDPVALPLTEGEILFTALSGFPGAILDSCPDRWGIKVIDRLMGKQAYPQGYLLINDPGRAGSLAFSRSATESPRELSSREFSLAELLAAAEALEAGRPLDPELLKALHPGTGGARPKCNVIDSTGAWIAKFPSADDAPGLSIPRLEHATLLLGKACGIDTVETRIQHIGGKDVCLVRRFDREIREGQMYRRSFLSARTLFYADTAYAAVATGSYARLSRWLPRYGGQAGERKKLFRRMVFNCAVRNDDDHELNHGLIHVQGDTFALAPAYDIVPNTRPRRVHHHALLIGDSGAGTVSNLLSTAEAFGLCRDEALALVAEIERKVRDQWQEVFYEAGFGDEDLRRVEHVFTAIPAASDADPAPPGRF